MQPNDMLNRLLGLVGSSNNDDASYGATALQPEPYVRLLQTYEVCLLQP